MLTIAGVRFSLAGLDPTSEFLPPFHPFLLDSKESDLTCEVDSRGPDEALATQPSAPDKPWSFTVSRNVCEVVRRNQEGKPLWKITGPLTFDRATVTWEPHRFTEYYGSYGRAWGTGLGLSLLVLRLRAQGGLVLHGTAAEIDGQGILCVGISGTGKSTLARLLDTAGAKVLTDERPALRQWPAQGLGTSLSNPFRVYGTPWPSSAGFARNEWAPLRRLYFLEHGERDRIAPVAPSEAVRRLLHVATIPWQDPALLDPCLATIETLLHAVPCAVLAFRPTPDIVEVIRADLRQPPVPDGRLG